MSDLLWRKPRLLVSTLALIAVAGLSALQVLPRAEDPTLTARFGNVFTAWPGADAARIEALVTDPLEDELREIEEIALLQSSSLAGSSTINIELADDVTEVDEVWSRVRDRLADAAAKLPAGAGTPEFDEVENSAWSLIAGLRWTLPTEPNLAILGRLAEELADELRGVSGTKAVEVFGEPREEILVEVDPVRLAAHGLEPRDVAEAVRRADAKVSAGRVHGDRNDLLLEVSGEIESLDRVATLPVLAGEDGRFVRVGDLARVRKAALEPASTLALLSGQPGIAVAARLSDGRRVDTWAIGARAAVERFRAGLPRGVEVVSLFDQSRYTDRRLADLLVNFLLGAGLVAVVVLLTMGWRSALIVGSALPLNSLIVLAGMSLLGVPIHQMSVTGLVIALGLMIDNAIVMVDEVRHRLDHGRSIGAAIRATVQAMAVPLGGSTITTVLAFMPLVLMPGATGEFVGSIAISVIVALIGSLALSLTVVPALAGWLERVGRRPTGSEPLRSAWRRAWRHGLDAGPLSHGYRRLVRAMFARPLLGIASAIVLPVVGFLHFGDLEEQFFPSADRDQFQIELRLPWQTPIAETRRAALVARDAVLQHPLVEDVHWFLGESAPRFYYNILDGRRGLPFYAQALVQLRSDQGSLPAVQEIQELLDRALPDLQALARPIEQGPPVDAPVELRVFGPDLDTLAEMGQQLREILADTPGVVHTRAQLEDGQPKLRVRLDDETARLAGVDNVDVADRLLARTDGVLGGSLVEGTEELPIRVRVADADRRDLAAIATTDLPRAGGGSTPLAAVAGLELVPEPASIPHRDGRRCNTVQAYVVAGTLPSIVVADVQRTLAERGFAIPAGYRLAWGGEAAERDKAVGSLLAAAAVLMVLMAAALVLSFDSFRLAAVIGLVALLSVGLALGSLWVFGYPFGFMAIIGAMGLVGVAVNDSIVVLTGLAHDAAARRGSLDAATEVVVRCTRHLLSTSLTTVVGFAPLLIAGGGFWPPLAIAIAGGVTGATWIAVTLVPAMFSLLVARRGRLRDAHGPTPALAARPAAAPA
ncbi:MAG: efflux RND transporter permease subunit [Planctomycetes bacterium]|nr:efflux RND transporter permease subunit [Planctomycetota bacterium]